MERVLDPFGWCAGTEAEWSTGPWEGGRVGGGVYCITVTYPIITVGFCCNIGKEWVNY